VNGKSDAVAFNPETNQPAWFLPTTYH